MRCGERSEIYILFSFIYVLCHEIIYVNKYTEHRNQTTKVFVGGLHDDTAEAEMSEHFGTFGEVLEVNIMYDRFTNAPRGFGFVTFKDPDVAHAVINYEQDHIVHGKKVDCKPATARKDAFKKFPDAPSSRVEKPTSREERWRKYHGHEDIQSAHTPIHSSHDPYSRSHQYPSYPRNDIPHHHHSSYGHRHPSSYPPPPPQSGYPSSHHSTHQPSSSSSTSSSSYPPPPATSYTHHNTSSYHYPAPNDPSRTSKDVTTATSTLPPYEYSRYDPYASYRQDPRYSSHYPPPPTQPPVTTTPVAAITHSATATPSTVTGANSTVSTSTVTASQVTANTGNTQATTTTQPTATPPTATPPTTTTTAPMYDYSQYQYPSYYSDQTHPTSASTSASASASATSSSSTASAATGTATAPRYDYYSQYGRVVPPRSTTTTKPNQSQTKTTRMPSGYGASRGSVATNSAQANRYSAY